MDFPKVTNCLISDDIREEGKGKATILGFYGLTPDVDILIKDIKKPMSSLSLSFLTEVATKEGKFNLNLDLDGPGGKKLIKIENLSFVIEKNSIGKKARITIKINNPTFGRAGTYTISFKSDGEEIYNSKFEVGEMDE